MPFTLSHPSILFPLYVYRKRWFSISGLITGSMVPDVKFFTSNSVIRHYSHNWVGALWVDIPLAILLCFLFHNIICKPLIHHLPDPMYYRFYKKEPLHWNRHFLNSWRIILASIIIGIYSHLLWDRFTHLSHHFVSALPWLKNSTTLVMDPMLVYRMIQSTYSVVGLTVEAFLIWKLPVVLMRRRVNNRGSYWSAIAGLSILIYVYFIQKEQLFIEDFIGLAMESVFISVFLVSLIYGGRRKRERE